MSGVDKAQYEKLKKERTFNKFQFRGFDIDGLNALKEEDFNKILQSRARRHIKRHAAKKPPTLLKRIQVAKKACKVGEKPATIKTHLRDVLINPGMVGGMVGVYNGLNFNAVEIKGEMIGHYLGEFSLTYKPVQHGRPGIGATHSSRFIPLK